MVWSLYINLPPHSMGSTNTTESILLSWGKYWAGFVNVYEYGRSTISVCPILQTKLSLTKNGIFKRQPLYFSLRIPFSFLASTKCVLLPVKWVLYCRWGNIFKVSQYMKERSCSFCKKNHMVTARIAKHCRDKICYILVNFVCAKKVSFVN